MIRIKYVMILSLLIISINIDAQSTFDIFSYKAPTGFTLKEKNGYLFYEKSEGKNYCQLLLYPAVAGQADVEKDFAKNWNFFARNPDQKVGDPETKELDSLSGWQMIMGAARGTFNKQMFAVTLSTFTKDSITYYIAAVFTDQKYIQTAQEFIASIVPDEKKFIGHTVQQPIQTNTQASNTNNSTGISKFITHFNDGWNATPTEDFVKITKAETELRLHYINPALDDARPNTIDAPEYYWSKYVEPYFEISSSQKWSGIEYPVIYFMEGNAIDRQTGKPCFVAIKIVYSGGARPIVVISPNENSYRQLFAHPNSIDVMLNYNKFAVTANDIAGIWKGGGGGGLEYYHVYTGNYAGMSTISTSDEFVFNTDGTYSSSFRSASTNFGSTQFGAVDYKGKFTVTDWTITATNRHNNKNTVFNAQLSAVKGGYLLFMSDSEYEGMKYTLFKTK